MEIHHHTHTDSAQSGTSRKKFTHYLWEFIMLFLAVFCGFIAENFREHSVERQREKIFARLLFDDLKKDSAVLHYIIMIKQWRNRKLDSLVYFLSLPDVAKQGTAIYYYSSFLYALIPFTPSDATIQQLRSSGTLRYFKNPELYNAITHYYSDCNFYLERENGNEKKNIISDELHASLFDANDFASITTITPNIMDASQWPAKEMHLLSADKKLVNQYLHCVNSSKKANELSIMLLGTIVEGELDQLIITLNKEFKLD